MITLFQSLTSRSNSAGFYSQGKNRIFEYLAGINCIQDHIEKFAGIGNRMFLKGIIL